MDLKDSDKKNFKRSIFEKHLIITLIISVTAHVSSVLWMFTLDLTAQPVTFNSYPDRFREVIIQEVKKEPKKEIKIEPEKIVEKPKPIEKPKRKIIKRKPKKKKIYKIKKKIIKKKAEEPKKEIKQIPPKIVIQKEPERLQIPEAKPLMQETSNQNPPQIRGAGTETAAVESSGGNSIVNNTPSIDTAKEYEYEHVDENPKFIKRVAPRYPDEAVEEEIEGVVVLRFTVSSCGKIKNIKVVKNPGYGLDKASIEALKKSIVKPAKIGSAVVHCRMEVSYRFRLDS